MKLKKNDAALKITPDFQVELHTPKMKDDEVVPGHVVLLAALAGRIHDAKFVNQQINWFLGRANKLEKKGRAKNEL